MYVSELRPKTAEDYESAVRLHIVPARGRRRLDGLLVQHMKTFLDRFKRKCLCCANCWDWHRPDRAALLLGGRLHLQDAKTEASEAVPPLPEVTRATLEVHRDLQAKKRVDLGDGWQDHGLILPSELGTPMEPRNFSRHFASLRAKAGLSVRLYDLRHTVVSVLTDLGVPPHTVQTIARHSDVKITLKIYAHSNLTATREALDKIDGW